MRQKNRCFISYIFGFFFCIYLFTLQSFLNKDRLDYEFYFTPTWSCIDDPHYSALFDTMWVLVGTFTIRMKEPAYLDFLSFKWKGPEPSKIKLASLYKGLKTTEEYLIADGYWQKEGDDYILIFEFPHKHRLHVFNMLYLVLTIAKESEETLRTGTFELLTDHLPGCLQKAVKQKPVYLTFAPPTKKSLIYTT